MYVKLIPKDYARLRRNSPLWSARVEDFRDSIPICLSPLLTAIRSLAFLVLFGLIRLVYGTQNEIGEERLCRFVSTLAQLC